MLKNFTVLSLLFFCGCSITPPSATKSLSEVEEVELVVEENSVLIDNQVARSAVVVEPEKAENPEVEDRFCEVFDDFSGRQNVGWQRVNDNVMGGRSDGRYDFEEEMMVLRGSINLNGGGFTSVRAPLSPQVLSDFDSVLVTAKSDGRGYQLTFRDQNRRRLSHRLALDLMVGDDWQEVEIRFEDLKPAFFGRRVLADGFNKNQAREIGIILNDGLGGDYELILKEIKFCQDS